MANYNLIMGSKFQPFSFERYMAPLLLYKDAYEKIEKEYDDLSTKASVWENLANEEKDPNTYKQYKKYADDLKNEANYLASNGLDVSKRQSMLDLKRRYGEEISPIELAFNKREALKKEQRTNRAQDKSLKYKIDLNTEGKHSSLDRFLEDPNYGYSESFSGNMIYEKAKQSLDYIGKMTRGIIETGRLGVGDRYYIRNRIGLNMQELEKAILDPKSTEYAKLINGVLNDAVNSTGVQKWNDPEALETAYNWAKMALPATLGKDEVSSFQYTPRAPQSGGIRTPSIRETPSSYYPSYPVALTGNNKKEDRDSRIQTTSSIATRLGLNQYDYSKTDQWMKYPDLQVNDEKFREAHESAVSRFANSTVDVLDEINLANALDLFPGNIGTEIDDFLGGGLSYVNASNSMLPTQLYKNYQHFSSPTTYAITTNGDPSKARWFYDDGNLYTRDKFIEQGNGDIAKHFLGSVYDQMKEDLSTIGNEPESGWTRASVYKALNDYAYNPNSSEVTGIYLPLDDKQTKEFIAQVGSDNIHKTTALDENGVSYDNGETLDLEGVDAGAAQLYYVPNDKISGVIMWAGTDTYYIPYENIYKGLSDKIKGVVDGAKKAQEYIDENKTDFNRANGEIQKYAGKNDAESRKKIEEYNKTWKDYMESIEKVKDANVVIQNLITSKARTSFNNIKLK